MASTIAVIIIISAVLLDYFWFDVDKKRWGWMESWSKFNKGLFFAGFIIASVLIYLGLDTEYF
ncbi:hypothetical protein [Metabacillus schmidteae]|uniref:hypothetical protein n=1 Tax=Metabacillus schmidteae TaxID=2730405 RepID=UPI00158F2193|nr:hypothetical protein [Metabacillus schmidteae]